MTDLPYRPNTGAVIFNSDGKVFVARRTDLPGAGGGPDEGVWQFPQGGIDSGEDPRAAVMREAREETGMTSLTVMAEYPDWLTYDLPEHLIGKALGGKYRGQTQKWFALRFAGPDKEIRLDLQSSPEFDCWKWISLEELPALNTGFKKPLYEKLASAFAQFGAPSAHKA